MQGWQLQNSAVKRKRRKRVGISSVLLQEAKTTVTILSTKALTREKQVLMWAGWTSL